MKIYRFNHDKIFIGIDEAPECPVTKRKRKFDPKIKKKFLPVRLSTTKPVPEYDVATQYAQFIDDEWVVKDIPVIEEPEIEYEEITEDKPLHDYLFEELEEYVEIEGNKKITKFKVINKKNLVVSEVKTILLNNAKNDYVAWFRENSDDYFIRQARTGEPVPQEIITAGTQKDSEYNNKKTTINACETIEELKELVTQRVWKSSLD